MKQYAHHWLLTLAAAQRTARAAIIRTQQQRRERGIAAGVPCSTGPRRACRTWDRERPAAASESPISWRRWPAPLELDPRDYDSWSWFLVFPNPVVADTGYPFDVRAWAKSQLNGEMVPSRNRTCDA